MEWTDALPVELWLEIFSHLQDTHFLFVLYSHVPLVRVLAQEYPRVLFSESYVLTERPCDALLYSVIAAPQCTLLVDRLLMILNAAVYPDSYQALLGVVPSITDSAMRMRLVVASEGILSCVAECGWLEHVAPLCAFFRLGARVRDEYLAIAAGACGSVETLVTLLATSEYSGDLDYERIFLAAVISGRDAVVLLLLREAKVGVAYCTTTALHAAAVHGRVDMFRRFLCMHKTESVADMVLRGAFEHNQREIVRLLLCSPPLVGGTVLKNDCLCWAARHGCADIVRLLLADCRVDADYNHNLPLIEAATWGHVEVVYLLLATNEVDPSHPLNLPLRRAIENNHFEVVRLLLGDHALNGENTLPKVRCGDYGNMALWCAADHCHVEMVRFMIATGRVDTSGYNIEQPIFLRAAAKDCVAMVQFLLEERGMNPVDKPTYFLCAAARRGAIKVLKLLLSLPGVDPGTKPLAAAVESGRSTVVQFLLETFAVPADVNELMRVAVKKRHVRIVRLLFATGRVDCSADGAPIFFDAIAHENPAILRLFFSNRGKLPIMMYHMACMCAIGNKCAAIVLELLGTGNMASVGRAIMRYAARDGHVSIIRYCLAHDFAVDADLFSHLVSVAVCNGHAGIVQALLALEGVDPAYDNSKALYTALDNGHYAVVRVLLNTNRVNPTFQRGALFCNVAKEGHADILELLMSQYNMDPSMHDNLALSLAVGCGCSDTVALLMATPKVDPSVNNNELLCVAARRGSVAMVRLLLEDSRVDAGTQDNKPLCVAVAGGRTAVVQLLLNTRNVDAGCRGNEPLCLAIDRRHMAIVRLLLADDRVDPQCRCDWPMLRAVETQDVALVKLLLDTHKVNPGSNGEQALCIAVKKGYTDIVRLLLNTKKVYIGWYNDDLIYIARRKQYTAIEKLLAAAVCTSYL